MFPEVPEDLSALSDEELNTLLDEMVAAFDAIAANAAADDNAVALLSAGADAIDAVRAEGTQRTEAAAARAEEVAVLAARVRPITGEAGGEGEGGDGEGEGEGEGGDGEGTEGEGDGEPETAPTGTPANPTPPADPRTGEAPAPTARAAAANRTIAQLNARQAASGRVPAVPRRTPSGPVTIVASGDHPSENIRMGQPIADMRQAAALMIDRWRHLGRSAGPEDSVPVVTFNLDYGDRFMGGKADDNMTRLAQFDTSQQGLVAAGGLCAPVAGYYDQLVIADVMRPVRDALPNFGADRGGVRFNPPPTLALITSGVGTVTAAQDLAGGAGGTKSCFTVTCPAITEVDITAVYNCLQFGNFGARTFPEQVEAWTKLALSLQARTGEQMLLDAIAAGSTAVTSAGLLGAGREVLARLGQAAAGYRNRNRMAADAPLRVMLPSWTINLMKTDFARSFSDEPGLLGLTDAQIAAFFDSRHLNVSYYVDSKTGGNQIFAAQAVGVLNQFPGTLYAYMFAEGTWLHLDGGTLDLGLVRDSTLNSTNVFRVFTETFENVAKVGPESLEIALAVAPDGSYGAAKTVTVPIVT